MTGEVEIRGLADFRKELRALDSKLPKEVRKVHKQVSDLVAARAKLAAAGGGRQSAKAAGAIRARATQGAAYIQTVPKPGFALGVFWGQKRRSGWFAAKRYSSSTGHQFQPWVGNQWEPGAAGGKPYFIGAAINQSLDEVEDIYLRGVDEIARQAFPN